MTDDPAGVKILAVCVLDWIAGDPRGIPHPVRGMGWIIRRYEQWTFRYFSTSSARRMAGIGLAAGLPLSCFMITWAMLWWAGQVHVLFGAAMWVGLGFTTLAGRDLWDHALRVYRALEDGSLVSARTAVSLLVGRETNTLPEEGIVRAALESISENTSDGIVAPLLYLAVGGPALAMAYKAINTLDSMVGYRTERYREFGWASARLDDAANWAPARLTAVAISLSAAFLFGTGFAAWRTCRRDARRHPSPNSGWPEAAMAGALGVQLGGLNRYGGIAELRPRLGDATVSIRAAHIPMALRIMGAVYGMFALTAAWVLW